MKAIVIDKDSQWDNLKIQEVETPKIRPTEVLVKVIACGVNPIDWKAPEYNLFEFLNMKLPYVVGSDIAGIVEQAGTNVKGFKVGDEVFGTLELTKQGAFAEYAAIDQNFISLKPKNLSFSEAAGVPLSSLTAWQGLFEKLELQAGQKILIQAAAGGVGIFAVQLAKLKGAYVVAVGSEKNAEFLKTLGADEIFDYKKDPDTLPKDFDAVFDSRESSQQTIPLLKKGGKYVSITEPASEDLAKKYDISIFNFLYKPSATQLIGVKQLIESCELKVTIDKTFQLEKASEALAYSKKGHSRGKIVLTVDNKKK